MQTDEGIYPSADRRIIYTMYSEMLLSDLINILSTMRCIYLICQTERKATARKLWLHLSHL